MIDNDNDADDFDNGTFDAAYTNCHYTQNIRRTTLGDLLKSMTTEDTKPMPYISGPFLFTFEINNSFEPVDRYSTDPERTDYRLYTENKVHFIKLIRALLDVCGLKEAKDLVENMGQPHRQYRDDDGCDWHAFTVRINSGETAMRIMAFILKIVTANDRYGAMRAEVGQTFVIRNVKMQPLDQLDYFTIG